MKVSYLMLWAAMIAWATVIVATGFVLANPSDHAVIMAWLMFSAAALIITIGTWIMLKADQYESKSRGGWSVCLALLLIVAFVGCSGASRTKKTPSDRTAEEGFLMSMVTVLDSAMVKPETATQLYAVQDSLVIALRKNFGFTLKPYMLIWKKGGKGRYLQIEGQIEEYGRFRAISFDKKKTWYFVCFQFDRYFILEPVPDEINGYFQKAKVIRNR